MAKKNSIPAPLPSFRQTIVGDIFPDAVSLSIKMSTTGTDLEPANALFKQLAALLGYDVTIRDHRTAAQRRVPKIRAARLIGTPVFLPGAPLGGKPPRV